MLKRIRFASAPAIFALSLASAQAQTPLSAYMDANGFLNVQTLTCVQLAGTFQEDAAISQHGTAAGTTVSRRSILRTLREQNPVSIR